MSLLCREFCLKVHLPADWNLGFFVRILQNQIFQATHCKNTEIFLRGIKDQYIAYVCSSEKKEWPSQGLAGHSLICGNIASQNWLPAARRKWIYAPMAFFFKPHIRLSALHLWGCGEGRSHLSMGRWRIQAREWNTGSRMWSFRGKRHRDYSIGILSKKI